MRFCIKFLPIFFVLMNILISCNQAKYREYYGNRALKSEFIGTKTPKKGIYRKYYKSGNIKQVDIYDNDVKVDSSVYYFEDYQNQIKEIRYFNDSSLRIVGYDRKGNKTKEGKSLMDDPSYRIGKWTFHKQKTKTDSIVEYITVDGKSYVNQIWHKNIKGDTILGRGNYTEIVKKDSFDLGDLVRLRFILMESFYGVNSDIIIIIPKDENLLKEDYSNLLEIERDTIQSLKNDGIPRPGIPKEMPINHIAEFGLKYDEPGQYGLRGALVEYVYKKLENAKKPDSIYRVERRLFFDDTFFIRDISDNVPR